MVARKAELVHKVIAVAGSDFFWNLFVAKLLEIEGDRSILLNGRQKIAPNVGLRVRFLQDIRGEAGQVVSSGPSRTDDPARQNLASVLGIFPIRGVEQVLHE